MEVVLQTALQFVDNFPAAAYDTTNLLSMQGDLGPLRSSVELKAAESSSLSLLQ